MNLTDNLKFNADGLIPVIIQDVKTKDVVMQAYMNKESIEKTLETGFMHYYSRSRKAIWKKGETSGNIQKVISLTADCDNDSILALVEQNGVACHTGEFSCFHNEITKSEKIKEDYKPSILYYISGIIDNRKRNKIEGSYTNYLFDKGLDKILKKVGEESAETIIAAKNQSKSEIRYEIADLIYHLSVLLSFFDMSWDDIFDELETRKK
ncbi:bifunctional phosphoribosyl-AMP cyclohydrolase/phosphoribosyl-ATP diphosphatase HisIE [Caldicellulosiruptoraceae bacterium PP1]